MKKNIETIKYGESTGELTGVCLVTFPLYILDADCLIFWSTLAEATVLTQGDVTVL